MHHDVVVAQRIAQEIVCGRVEADAHLRTAHVDVVCVFRQGAGRQVIFIQRFASTFHERYVARGEQALYADALVCLEVTAQDEFFRLLQ